jgi:hypothetical protein
VTTYWLRICRSVAVALLLVASASTALADKQKALDYWKNGNTSYTLGKFEEAIKHFENAFVEHPAPAFLFNIAQCHRQLDNCERAAFFYKRYLSLKPDAANRAEVEGYIAEAERCQEKKRQGRSTPPPPGGGAEDRPKDRSGGSGARPDNRGGDGAITGSGAGSTPVETKGGPTTSGGTAGSGLAVSQTPAGGDTAGGSPTAGTADGGSVAVRYGGAKPPLEIVSRAGLGAALVDMGRLRVPPLASLLLSAGARMQRGKLSFEPGLLINLNAMKYQAMSTGTALMTSVMANAPATMELMPKLFARGELGLGALVLSGVRPGNPFTNAGEGLTGPLAMAQMRVALGVDYDLSEQLRATFTPVALSVGLPREGLDDSIRMIARFDVMAGVGYRF